MDQGSLTAALAGLPLGGLRFFASTGSTNDQALEWASNGAEDLSLVVADEQTAGRGRSGRKWHTLPGSALALSLILRPTPLERTVPARLTGLAALAVVQCCRELALQAQVKWPNDVLVSGRKVAGILVESDWAGNALRAVVVGIGINVTAGAVPPADQLTFPATSVEAELGRSVDREELLRDVVRLLLEWRAQIGTQEFLRAWEEALAYRDQRISVGADGVQTLEGTLLGLAEDGSLRLLADGMPTIVHFGEIHLRPTDDKMG